MSEIPLNNSQTYFPFQKQTDAQKDETFYKKCIDAGVSMVNWNITNLQSNVTVRNTRRNKIVGYRLYNNIVDKKEMELVTNPFQLENTTFPSTYRNYPLINANIAILVGEERKRPFNPLVTCTSFDIVNKKLGIIKDQFTELVRRNLTAGMTDQKQIEAEIQTFDKWRKYEFKDIRERMGTQIINYHYKTQDLGEVFSRGFEDYLISSEEIYVVDIVGGEPILRKGNPLNFYTLRGGESYKIEDNDIIVEDGYLSVGETIDRYHEYLTPEQIDTIEQGYSLNKGGARQGIFTDQLSSVPYSLEAYTESLGVDNLVMMNSNSTLFYNGSFDTSGNVRVTRTVWRGMRKVGFKYWYDDDGSRQMEIVPEQYKPKKELGEEVEWDWISEWYEGTRIANEIYVKYGPLEFQARHMDNPSICSPGIVGTINNVNSNKAQSLLDNVKEYQYLYNAIMYRTILAISKYLGKVGTIDLSMKPTGWEMDKMLYYMYTMNLKFEDPYNEVNKGVAMGKIMGNANNRSQNLEVGDLQAIQSNMQILDFLQKRLDETCGITAQRKGAIENRETVGGVERAVSQSSYITEKWFSTHDLTKVRALRMLLEASKVAWKDKSFKRQFVMDDGTIGMLEYDDMLFREADYDVDISTTSADAEMFQTLKSFVPQMMQNKTPMSIVMELIRTKNPTSLQRKVETWEEEQQQMLQQQQETELKAQQDQLAQAQQQHEAELQQAYQFKEQELELQQYTVDANNATKIQIEEIRAYNDKAIVDANNNGIPDAVELGKLSIEQNKVASDHYHKTMEKTFKENELRMKDFLEKRKLDIEDKKIKADKELQIIKDKNAMAREKLKAKTALKNKVSGEK